ncbi:uncharacterized protein LOC135101919 isoform X2 [Scylla paramamosain]|uniref:uncharacterized protein LOC135101919 isoform X2 n=1 Tax=Scylla paramamosain TaxID=85552 RepID=UPI003082D9E7
MYKWFKSRNGGDGSGGALGNSAKGRASLRDTQAALASALESITLKDNIIQRLQEEIVGKEATIADLNTQLDKLRSVLPPPTPRTLHGRLSLRTHNSRNNNNNEHHNRNSLQNDSLFPMVTLRCSGLQCSLQEGAESRVKRTAISAEPAAQDLEEFYDPEFAPPPVPKSEESKDLLRQAILENDFLKNLEIGQVKEIVESMYSVTYEEGSLIIKEGDIGSMLYIMEGMCRDANEAGQSREYDVVRVLCLFQSSGIPSPSPLWMCSFRLY